MNRFLVVTILFFLTPWCLGVSAYAQGSSFLEATFGEESNSLGKGHGLSMDLQDDLPVLAYYAPSEISGSREIRLAVWDLNTHAWIEEVVTTISDMSFVPWTHKTSLVMVGGVPHIFFSGANNQLFYANKQAGSWSIEAVTEENSGGLNPTSVWDGSSFYTCYKDDSSDALWVVEGSAGSWARTQLEATNSNTGRYCHIALKASGEPAVVSHNQADQVPSFVEKMNGSWTDPVAIDSPSTYDKGYYPHMLVLSNGTLRVYYKHANAGSNADGSLMFVERAGGGGSWSSPSSHSLGSQIGGYPSFLVRSNGRVFGAIRRRYASGLFGNSAGISRYEELEEGLPIAGLNLGGRKTSAVYLAFISLKEASDGSLFVSWFDSSNNFGTGPRIGIASHMVNGRAAPGVEPVEFQVTARDSGGSLVTGAKVSVNFGGEEHQKITGPDGRVTISARGSGDYTVSITKSGYQFEPVSDTITTSTWVAPIEIIGSAPVITLSGTVRTSVGHPLSSPTLTLNGTQILPIDAATGAFSIEVSQGMEYELTIEDSEWIFMNPTTKGTIYGDTTHRFVGFPK